LIDTAVSLLDLEESLESPGWAPGVSTEPVVKTSFISPSEDLDGVTTIETTTDVLIDSALIVEEILIDRELGFNGSVGKDFRLDLVWGGHFND